MLKLIVAVVVIALLSTLAWWGVHYEITTNDLFVADKVTPHYLDFDMAGYAFGLVAVAVSCAGIYFSVVIERLCDQFMRLVVTHLVHEPFSDVKLMEDICRPMVHSNGYEQPISVKAVYAIVRLTRWATLEKDERKRLLGKEGMNADRIGHTAIYAFLQSGTDKTIVVAISFILTLLYLTVPYFYISGSRVGVLSSVFMIYGLAVLEIVTCAVLYAFRWRLIAAYEDRMGLWRTDIKNYLIIRQQTLAATKASEVEDDLGRMPSP